MNQTRHILKIEKKLLKARQQTLGVEKELWKSYRLLSSAYETIVDFRRQLNVVQMRLEILEREKALLIDWLASMTGNNRSAIERGVALISNTPPEDVPGLLSQETYDGSKIEEWLRTGKGMQLLEDGEKI